MTIFEPAMGLLFWNLVAFVHLPLMIVAEVLTAVNRHLSTKEKLVWILLAFFIPVLGPVLSLIVYGRTQKEQTPEVTKSK